MISPENLSHAERIGAILSEDDTGVQITDPDGDMTLTFHPDAVTAALVALEGSTLVELQAAMNLSTAMWEVERILEQ